MRSPLTANCRQVVGDFSYHAYFFFSLLKTLSGWICSSCAKLSSRHAGFPASFGCLSVRAEWSVWEFGQWPTLLLCSKLILSRSKSQDRERERYLTPAFSASGSILPTRTFGESTLVCSRVWLKAQSSFARVRPRNCGFSHPANSRA
jgi:hypothetical protein